MLTSGLVAMAACGSGGSGPSADLSDVVPVAARVDSPASPNVAGEAITEFGLDLFATVRAGDAAANVTVSPASVAISLAMLEPGTVDAAQEQMRVVLRIDDADLFHSSMNALEQSLETRVAQGFKDDDDPGEVTVSIANAAYLQRGVPFSEPYLETVGANYGPVLNETDFGADPAGVVDDINAFIAEATNDRIVDLLSDDAVGADTVLALVNALYLAVSWTAPFPEDATVDAPFTRLDGTKVEVPLMAGSGSSSAAGDGWVGATKEYVGNLYAQFILPDEGRFDEIAARLGAVLAEYEANRTSGAPLSMPRFETRSNIDLPEALMALGLVAPFDPGGLLGLANDPRMLLDKVVHESFVAIDEDGVEAAAATVSTVIAISAPVQPPEPVVLDRPFLYRIVDRESGATLFVGQITDPTA